MATWTRPYADRARVLYLVMAVVMTVLGGVMAVFAATHLPGWAGVALFVLAALAISPWLVFAWRLYRIGLVVSHGGVRLRWLTHTRTVPWLEIGDFRSRPVGTTQRLYVVLRDGSQVRTPVQGIRHRPVGLGVLDGGTQLLPQRYERLLADLRIHLAHPDRLGDARQPRSGCD